MSTLTTPNSMLQRRGGSSGGKMSSMSWLFVILGVQMVVFLGFVVVFFGFEQRRQGELEEMQGELHRLRRENMRNSNKLMRANTRMLKYEADIKKELDTSVGGANGDYDGADFTPGGDDAGARRQPIRKTTTFRTTYRTTMTRANLASRTQLERLGIPSRPSPISSRPWRQPPAAWRKTRASRHTLTRSATWRPRSCTRS